MKVKAFALYSIIGILVATALIVFAHSQISGNAVLNEKQKILPGVPTPEKYKPIYPDDEMHILPIKTQCKEGGRRCVGTNLQGCIGEEWITMSVCRPGTTCTLNGCKAIQPGCSSGERRCAGINLQGCIDGQWEVLATCRSGDYCTTSGCKPSRPSCTPGARRCISNNLQACIGDQWITTAVCGQDQYCSSQGCITIPPSPSNIIFVGAQGLSCPTKPNINVPFPDPVTKDTDCDLKTADVEFYLKSLENAVSTCSQLQGQQLTLAQADVQYLQYQLNMLYPSPIFTPYSPTCNLVSPTQVQQSPPEFVPPEGNKKYTEWLSYITQTAKNYCASAQSIITPVIDGCTNINANLPVCGTDYGAQVVYNNYLNTQMSISSTKAMRATALSTTFELNAKQFRDSVSKTGIAC
jgi:hypothetical protein